LNLKVICAWCRCSLGEKACYSLDERLPAITHSICSICKQRVFDGMNDTLKQSAQKKTDYYGKEIQQ
jgi:hypothetical protein